MKFSIKKIQIFLLLFVAIVLLLGAVVPLYLLKGSQQKVLQENSEKIISDVTEAGSSQSEASQAQLITQKARDVAQQMSMYFKYHKKANSNSEEFKSLAVQSIGDKGYTALYECDSCVTVVHRNKDLNNKDLHYLKDKFPDWWRIYDRSKDCAEASGYYYWKDSDGITRKKFMAVAPVKGTKYMLAATTYLDEFASKKRSIELIGKKKRVEMQGVLSAAVNKHIGNTILIALAVIGFLTILAISIAKGISGFIHAIGRFLVDIGNGRYRSPINTNTNIVEFSGIVKGLHEMRGKILRYQDELIAQERTSAIGEIAAHVAHDIRSPLSSMQAALMMLRKNCEGNKDTKDYLDLLQLSSTRLEGISNELLAKHKGEEASAQTFSIHEVLDELIGELRASPIGQGTEFVKHYHSSALYVSGDKTGISRAFGNIIKNALEAMQKNPAERPKQLIASTSFEPPPHPASGHLLPQGEGIIIRITDTGLGIPADKIPLILQGGHTEGKEDGHGIGTKVVRDVVDAHKGTLNIESEMEKGATFIVTLPIANIATQDNGSTIAIPYSGTAPICIIDDEPSLREQWRLTLKALGAEVVTHTCWEDLDSSVASLHQNDKDCTFIVDYHFDNSEVDGLEIIQRLKERGFSQFILATAEYWKPAIKDAAKELNITLCPKPLPKVVLAQCHPEPQAKDLDSSATPQNDKSGPSVLLIDDDEAIRMTWKAVKKILGVDKLTTYSNLEEMIAAATNPADYDMCVIDKNIQGSQYNGAKMLAHLKENGAKKVFLATGEGRRQIEQDPAFASIDGIITEKIPMSLTKYLS